MTDFPVAQAARICGGRLEGDGDATRIGSVEIDSRRVGPGHLFVALPGERTHGNAFVVDAFERGAVAAIVGPECERLPERFADRALIRVKYPRKSLADLAAAHRRTLRCPVIAVTGSNGKSSTREMIAKVLEPLGPVVQSEKSFNNELGVPLTLLRAGRDTVALVVEMGTNGRGEIKHLCGITKPDVGVILNVGAAHLEGLRSEEGVAREKGALAESIPESGTLVLNADDHRVVEMAARARTHRVITYSVERTSATIWGHAPARTANGVAVWLYGKARIELPVPGLHNLSNLMAAASVGMLHGITPAEMMTALRDLRLPALRMQVTTHGGATFVLDCYNSNPDSLQVAVEELAARSVEGRRILVLGDMLELGLHCERLHREAGRSVADRVDVLWCVGPEAGAAAEAARGAGLAEDRVIWSATTEIAMAQMPLIPASGDTVLFKGSRNMGLERLAARLAEVLDGVADPPARLVSRDPAKKRKVG